MKKIIVIIVLIAVAFIPFSGCRKIADHIFQRDTSIVSSCRIAKIFMTNDFSPEVRTGIVYYNDHNDPDSVIFDFEGSSAGVALMYFTYDGQHRLVQFRKDYSHQPGDYYIKHTYVYENGIAVRDTIRGRIAGQWTEVNNIHYDLNGRIIKVTRRVIEVDNSPWEEEVEPFTFAYDASGNLGGETSDYDTKINFLRTNKVWMFTHRDYSMNNLLGATSYNDYGLPLAFEEQKRPFFLVYGVSSLEYECSAK